MVDGIDGKLVFTGDGVKFMFGYAVLFNMRVYNTTKTKMQIIYKTITRLVILLFSDPKNYKFVNSKLKIEKFIKFNNTRVKMV